MGDEKEIKEPFCAACLAVPAALVGAGAAGAGSKQEDKTKKKLLMWGGIAISIISILIAIYFLFIKKCSSCR